MIGLGFGIGISRSSGFNVASLFANGEIGALYDPSDFSTLFQDYAGTIPVTAVGHPVGLRLDKSGNGNNALQTTATARPIYARIPATGKNNLLKNSLWVGGAIPTGWTQPVATGTSSAHGTVNGNNIYRHTAVVQRTYFSPSTATTLAAGGQITASVYIDEVFSGSLQLQQILALVGSGFTISYSVDGVEALGTDLITANTRLSVTATSTGATSSPAFRSGVGVTSNATGDFAMSRPMINVGSTALTYQNSVSNYDTTEDDVTSIYILKNDGIDDALNTTFPNLGADVTIARSLPVTGASILTGQTIGAGTWSDNIDSCALVIVNRALTPAETAGLTSWLNAKAGL